MIKCLQSLEYYWFISIELFKLKYLGVFRKVQILNILTEKILLEIMRDSHIQVVMAAQFKKKTNSLKKIF